MPFNMNGNTTDTPLWSGGTLEAMRLWGGGFVRQLRMVYLVADADNRARIAAAWPELGQQYREMAKRLRDAGAETLDLPAASPDPLGEALNSGDGSYRP